MYKKTILSQLTTVQTCNHFVPQTNQESNLGLLFLPPFSQLLSVRDDPSRRSCHHKSKIHHLAVRRFPISQSCAHPFAGSWFLSFPSMPGRADNSTSLQAEALASFPLEGNSGGAAGLVFSTMLSLVAPLLGIVTRMARKCLKKPTLRHESTMSHNAPRYADIDSRASIVESLMANNAPQLSI